LTFGAVLAGVLSFPTLARAGNCDAWDQRLLHIDSPILIDGQVRSGMVVHVGTENEIVDDALGISWEGARGVTDAQGRLKIDMCYTGFNAAFGINPNMIFRFRTDWNGDTQHVHWGNSFGQGVGTVPQSCTEGQDKIGLLCYTKCPAGTKRVGVDCHSVCPAGMRDDGLFCRKSEYGRGAGYPLWDEAKCNRENSQGCEKNGLLWYPKCAPGYHAFGCCICRPDPPNCAALGLGGQIDLSCAKKVIVGSPHAATCAAGKEEKAGLCYTPLDDHFAQTINFTGAGAKSFVPLRPVSKVRFRFPAANPELFNNHDHLIVKNFNDLIYEGPYHNDHMAPKGSGGNCFDFDDNGGIASWGSVGQFCYGGHRGTDYILAGGFDQMDKPNTNLVVAAADGIVDEIVDSNYDRCRADLFHSDYAPRINCDGQLPQSAQGNHIIIRHNMGHEGDPAYAPRSIYYHIKKGSASSRISVGQFIPCGTVIAEVGSSGNSSTPHLHFEVEHYNPGDPQAHADPYQGKLSAHTYWVNQNGGSRGFPSMQCQSPLERYGANYGSFAATLTANAPQDLGIQQVSPLGQHAPVPATRYWKVTVRVPASSLVGFKPDMTSVKYTFPKTALVASNPSKADQDAVFFVPIANARDPKLSEYAFDVHAAVTQSQQIGTPVTRYVSTHVSIPRPTVEIVSAGATEAASTACANGIAYSVSLSAKSTGLIGATKMTWKTMTTADKQLAGAPSPLTLCYGEGASATASVTDAAGIETATESFSVATPTFVAPLAVSPVVQAAARTIAIPAGSMLASTGGKSAKVYQEIRVVVSPQEHGGRPFTNAATTEPVSIAWKDLTYRDRDGSWKPIAARGGKVTYRLEKTKQQDDTIVLMFQDLSWPTQFGAAVSVTDSHKRVAHDTIHSSNGELATSAADANRRDLLNAAGFSLGHPADPHALVRRDPGTPAPDALYMLLRDDTLLDRKNKGAVTKHGDNFAAFSTKFVQARATNNLASISGQSRPKFSVQPTVLSTTPMIQKLVQMNHVR
jgi:murein DD-endopeptidase MepM/ murein hydrolase activator NlpD